MSRLVSREQALALDKLAQETIDAQRLMEIAGHRMAEKILKKALSYKRVLVLVGPGNNGGDANIIARALQSAGHGNVVIFKAPFFENLESESSDNCFVIDGIFGVGLERPLAGRYLEVIQWINSSNHFVVSVDLPSGLNADTGNDWKGVVRADETLTVLPQKIGSYLREGVNACGKLVSISVFEEQLIHQVARKYFLMELAHAKKWWPKRNPTANKSRFGRAFVVAGSEGKWGAAVLSLRAAFRVGVGYVMHAASGNRDTSAVLSEIPEAMSTEIEDVYADVYEKDGAIAIGPGSGTSKEILELIKNLKKSRAPVVLDADAITILSLENNILPLPRHWIVTPHAAELSRISKWSVEEINLDPVKAAQAAQKLLGCTVVLKGLYTVVVSGYSKRVIIVPKGNVALAKAGTGDVLTGIIVGLLGQKIHPLKACLLGIFLHGLTADQWIQGKSSASLTASDLIELLPTTIKMLEAN